MTDHRVQLPHVSLASSPVTTLAMRVIAVGVMSCSPLALGTNSVPPALPAPEVVKPTVPKPAAKVPLADPESTRAEKERELRDRYLPREMSADRLDRLSALFSLDAVARGRFTESRERYETESRAARSDDARRLLQMLPAAFRYDATDTAFAPIYTPELVSTLRLADRIGDRVRDAEATFARDLDRLCDASKRPAWRVERIARLIELYGHPSRLPGARINLLEFLPKTGIAESDLASLEIILERYTEDLAKAIDERHVTLRGLELQRSESLVGLGPEWRAGRTLEEALSAERELAKLDTAEVRSDVPLRELNTRTVERIRKMLAPVAARRVLVAWQGLVHPELFEEERLFRAMLEEYVALPGIAEPEVTAGVETLVQTEEILWPVGQKAIEMADGIIVSNQLPPTDAAAARILLEGQLQKLLVKRRAAVREALRRIELGVNPEQASFLSRIQDTRATLDAQDRASKFIMEQLASRSNELAAILAMGETPGTAGEEALRQDGAPEPTTVPASGPETPKIETPFGPPGSEQAKPTSPRQPDGRNGRGSRRSSGS